MVKHLAGKLKLEFEQVFPFSTGEILKQLPEKKMLHGIDRALKSSHQTFEEFAESIMTTDTVRKIASQNLQINGKLIHCAGCCKRLWDDISKYGNYAGLRLYGYSN